jgi:hypothetical protein
MIAEDSCSGWRSHAVIASVHTPESPRDLDMPNLFFEHSILNSPYGCPQRYWELDAQRQPTWRSLHVAPADE